MKRTTDSRLTLPMIFRSTEVKRRLLITIGMLLLFRIGAFIPLPGIPSGLLLGDSVLAKNLINTYDLFAGGTLSALSVFALGIGPYINASIIIQMLTPIVPQLKSLRNEGQFGQREIKRITRRVTAGLALFEGFMLSMMIANGHAHLFALPLPLVVASSTVLLAAAAVGIMFLADYITDNGIGNGSSLLICAGITSRIPGMIHDTNAMVQAGQTPVWGVGVMLAAFTMLAVGAVILQNSVKRIEVNGGKSSTIRPGGKRSADLLLPMNPTGVMPIVFASQVLMFLSLATNFVFDRFAILDRLLCGDKNFGGAWVAITSNPAVHTLGTVIAAEVQNFFSATRWEYSILYGALILYFAAFYSSIVLPPTDIAESLRRDNRVIAGVKPGKPTVAYLSRTIKRLSLSGAAAIACMAIIPLQLAQWTQVTSLLGFGSTSVLIITGVALDTQRQVVAHALGSRYHTKQILKSSKDEEST